MSSSVVNLPLPGGSVVGAPPEIDEVIVSGLNVPKGYNNAIRAEATQVQFANLTSAQLLVLKSGGGVKLVPSDTAIGPGAGLVYRVSGLTLKFNFKTTAYTLNAGTLKLFLGPPATGIALTADLSALLTQTATSDSVGIAILPTGIQLAAAVENLGLWIGNTSTADFTAGDGTLDVELEYMILQV